MPSTITTSPPSRVDPPLSSSGKSHASASSVSDASWSLTQWPSAAPAAFSEDGTDEWINVAFAAVNHSGGGGGGEDCMGDDQDQKFQEEAHWTSFQRAIQSFAAQRQESVTRHTTGSSSSSSIGKKNSTGAGTHCSIVGRPATNNNNRVALIPQHSASDGDSSNVHAKEECVKCVIQETASISIHDSSSTANREEGKDQRLN